MHHELKTDPKPFAAVYSGAKNNEFRRNDRNYQAGDTLLLRETRYSREEMKRTLFPKPLEYTGRTISAKATHVSDAVSFYISPDGRLENNVILSLKTLRNTAANLPKSAQEWARVKFAREGKANQINQVDARQITGEINGYIFSKAEASAQVSRDEALYTLTLKREETFNAILKIVQRHLRPVPKMEKMTDWALRNTKISDDMPPIGFVAPPWIEQAMHQLDADKQPVLAKVDADGAEYVVGSILKECGMLSGSLMTQIARRMAGLILAYQDAAEKRAKQANKRTTIPAEPPSTFKSTRPSEGFLKFQKELLRAMSRGFGLPSDFYARNPNEGEWVNTAPIGRPARYTWQPRPIRLDIPTMDQIREGARKTQEKSEGRVYYMDLSGIIPADGLEELDITPRDDCDTFPDGRHYRANLWPSGLGASTMFGLPLSNRRV